MCHGQNMVHIGNPDNGYHDYFKSLLMDWWPSPTYILWIDWTNASMKKLSADRERSDDTTGGNAPLSSMAVDSPNGTAEEWFNGLVYILVGKITENLEEILRNILVALFWPSKYWGNIGDSCNFPFNHGSWWENMRNISHRIHVCYIW